MNFINKVKELYPWITQVHGPYTRKGDNRKHAILYSSETQTKQTISYSKLLLEIKIGRRLTENESCDHIDNNARNDDPSNLQVLTKQKNAKLARKLVSIECKCSKIFKPKHIVQQYCSSACGKRFGIKKNQYTK